MAGDQEKFNQTLTTSDAEWLRGTYHGALNLQEAVRMAVQDARAYHQLRASIDLEEDDD